MTLKKIKKKSGNFNSGSLGVRRRLNLKKEDQLLNCSEQLVVTFLERAEILEVTLHVSLLGSTWYFMELPQSFFYLWSLPGQPLPNVMTHSSLNLKWFPRPWNWGLPQEIICPPWQKTDLGQLDISYNAEEILCLSSIGTAPSPQVTSLKSVSMLEIPLRGCVSHNFDKGNIFSLNS